MQLLMICFSFLFHVASANTFIIFTPTLCPLEQSYLLQQKQTQFNQFIIISL